MDLIFNHQLTHQRVVIGTIGRARRKWKHLYYWFPVQQRRVYSEMDRIYKETREKHDKTLFIEYCHERHLNNRILKEGRQPILDKEEYCKYSGLKPILDKYNGLPLLYYDGECGNPGFCQQLGNAAVPN